MFSCIFELRWYADGASNLLIEVWDSSEGVDRGVPNPHFPPPFTPLPSPFHPTSLPLSPHFPPPPTPLPSPCQIFPSPW